MSCLVFASSMSRLHADLVIVRLKHAGIALSSLAVIYPLASRPNSTRCWLGLTSKLQLPSGEKVGVAGFLRSRLKNAGAKTLRDKLGAIGLSDEQRSGIEEALREDHVIVAIETEEKFELPTALRMLQRLGAEKIIAVEVASAAVTFGKTHSFQLHPAGIAAFAVAAA